MRYHESIWIHSEAKWIHSQAAPLFLPAQFLVVYVVLRNIAMAQYLLSVSKFASVRGGNLSTGQKAHIVNVGQAGPVQYDERTP